MKTPTNTARHALDHIAEQVVTHGTHSVAPVLEAMAAAVQQIRPGVAAALVDWDGSEVARQRAFGIAHLVVVDERAMAVPA
jgi:hypothetical protein